MGESAIGPDTAAGRRLRDSREFPEFLRTEMNGMIARWRAHRASHTD